MKTRCPGCHTAFRVTPDQLKARAGKVRCGQCQAVFNALDYLLDETNQVATSVTAAVRPVTAAVAQVAPTVPTPSATARPAASEQPSWTRPSTEQKPVEQIAAKPLFVDEPRFVEIDELPHFEPLVRSEVPAHPHFEPFAPATSHEPTVSSDEVIADSPHERHAEPTIFFTTDDIDEESSDVPAEEPPLPLPPDDLVEAEEPSLSETEVQELGKATGMILPRETTEIPGYSKWSEDPLSLPFDLPEDPPSRWPAVIFALLLILGLCGQSIFHFRTEIVTALPALRPAIAAACEAFGAEIPLPRRSELVSIEVSDLQTDREHDNLLALHATLRNRAPYAQAYPMLELSLTDTQDGAIVRRVIKPAEYLSPKTSPDGAFPANGDLAVRLWIDASSVVASGYRLYVFYP